MENTPMKLGLAVPLLLFAIGCTPAFAADRHLFYMHGSNLDGVRKDNHVETWRKIVSRLENRGYTVHAELRDTASVEAYAEKVASEVRALLDQGVDPGDIIVSGFSKGAVISLLVSSRIAQPEVKYVLLAGCTDLFDVEYDEVSGNILSIYELTDDKFGSCADMLSGRDTVRFKEVMLDTGKGHKVFRKKKDKWIRTWLQPMDGWIKRD